MFEILTSIKDSIYDTTESISSFVGDIVDFTIDEVKDNSSKVWNGVTGKDKFIEADKLHKKITRKYHKAENSYEEQSKLLLESLEQTISSINNYKQEIYRTHFSQFTLLANRLHNLSIQGESFLEYFDSSIYEMKNLNGMRSRNDMFNIDFNNLKAQEIATGIITLGWYTRSQASETLKKVEEEENGLLNEIENMNSHIAKLEQALSALENVEEYFVTLIQNYEKLLYRFKYGIYSQIQKNILNEIPLIDGKLDFKLMPIVHIEEFQALFNLSIVLKTMATMGYLDEEGNVKEDDKKAVNNIKLLVNNSTVLAA